MCARGLHMCGFSSHIFCWEDRAALTGIIFLEGLLGFAPHCLAVLLEPEVTSLLPAWGEDLQEVSPLQEKLEVGITLQTWGSREQKTTLEKLQEKCKRSEITSRPSLESHKSSWLCKHTRTQKVLRCDNNVAAVWPWITVWFRPLGSAAYLGALRSFVSPSGPWHTGVTPQTCFSRVLFVCTTWCHPELPTLCVHKALCGGEGRVPFPLKVHSAPSRPLEFTVSWQLARAGTLSRKRKRLHTRLFEYCPCVHFSGFDQHSHTHC